MRRFKQIAGIVFNTIERYVAPKSGSMRSWAMHSDTAAH
jgi:hypothetical protein